MFGLHDNENLHMIAKQHQHSTLPGNDKQTS